MTRGSVGGPLSSFRSEEEGFIVGGGNASTVPCASNTCFTHKERRSCTVLMSSAPS